MSIDAWLEGFFGTTRTDRLFHPDALWRDYLSFDWDLITHEGLDAIAKAKLPVQGKIIVSPSSTRTASIFSIFKTKRHQ